MFQMKNRSKAQLLLPLSYSQAAAMQAGDSAVDGQNYNWVVETVWTQFIMRDSEM